MSSVAIIQPSFIPWVGYFQIMSNCQHFVFYDDVQYDRRGWRNRNKIYTAQGPQWITVPVKNKGLYLQKINQTQIDYSSKWITKSLNSIKYSYAKSPFFEVYYTWLESVFNIHHESIADLDIRLTNDICNFLQINCQLHRSSKTPRDAETSKIDSLISICKNYGARTYVSGPSAYNYIGESSAFKEADIELKYAKYVLPPINNDRIHLSIIDSLFQIGPETKNLISRLELIDPKNFSASHTS